jgi:hypothetical protein
LLKPKRERKNKEEEIKQKKKEETHPLKKGEEGRGDGTKSKHAFWLFF